MKKNIIIPWEIIIKDFKLESTIEEKLLLKEWLSDAENQNLYKELNSLWLTLMQAGSEYVSNTDELWKQMEKRMYASKPQKKFNPQNSFRWLAMAASFLLVILLGSGGYVAVKWYHLNNIHRTYFAISEKNKLQLPDSSIVWLNTGSQLTYISTPFDSKRKVKLEGEAFFDVTKDSSRPFIVNSDEIRVIVHGTKFNVEAYREQNEIAVSLLSGSVSINTPKGVRKMISGEKALYNKKTVNLKIEAGAQLEGIWAANNLSINQLSLREVAVHLSKWYNINIHISSKIPDSQLYTLTISKEDSIEDILILLSNISHFKYRFIDNNNIEIIN